MDQDEVAKKFKFTVLQWILKQKIDILELTHDIKDNGDSIVTIKWLHTIIIGFALKETHYCIMSTKWGCHNTSTLEELMSLLE